MYRFRPASVAPPLPLAKQRLIRIDTRMQMDGFIVWVVMIIILTITAVDMVYKNMIYNRILAHHSLYKPFFNLNFTSKLLKRDICVV